MAPIRLSPKAAAKLTGQAASTKARQLVRENAERWIELSELRVAVTQLELGVAVLRAELQALRRVTHHGLTPVDLPCCCRHPLR